LSEHPEANEVPAVASPAERKTLPFRVVATGFVLSIAAALAIAVVIYVKLIRYERVAALHLPPDSTAAVRLDVEKAVLYEPVRKHLLPLANEAFDRNATRSGLAPRLKRIHQKTGIELAIDMREVALAHGPGSGDWVLVIGGMFPKDGVVRGIGAALAEEGVLWKLSADGKTLVAPSGIALGQASDGAVLLASSPSRLASALPRQDTHARLGLALEGPGGFVVAGAAARQLGEASAGSGPSWNAIGHIERVTGTFAIGAALDVQVLVDLGPGADAALAQKRLSLALESARAALHGPDFGGERRLLERSEVGVAGPSELRVRAPWERTDVDRAAHSLSMAVRRWAGAS
jgi:hypothetical protein